MKVEVEIPLPNTKTFRDWAIINEIDEDLVSLQLSRDILPEGVNLRVGQVLTITSQSGGDVYACRAFLVSKGLEQELLLRFTSETVANELREFYRVDAFLPIIFHILYDQNPANVKKLWEGQLKQRRDEEANRKRSRLETKRRELLAEERAKERRAKWGDLLGEPEVTPQDKPQEEDLDNQYYTSWGAVTALAVNISGGGLKIFTDQKFNVDELILLEIYIPSAECFIDVISRVVFTNYRNTNEDSWNSNSTAMHFVFIDEPARSAINNHISRIQLRRIRQFKGFTDVEPTTDNALSSPDKHYAYIDSIGDGENTDHQNQIQKPTRQQILLGILIICVICLLCFYSYRYGVIHHENQIQEIFQNSIKKYKGNSGIE